MKIAERISLNKYKISIVFLFFSFFLLFFSFSFLKFSSLKFFILIPLTVILGLGYISLFKTVFKVRNILTYIILGSFLGIFFNTTLIFFLGTLNLKISGLFYSVFLPFMLLFSLCLFFLRENDGYLKELIKNTKFQPFDVVWFIILAFFSFVLVNICIENYFPNWDNFNIWAVDAKYIFTHKALRSNDFDLLSNSYLSFYPLQLSYVYWLYGEIVEQFSSLIAVFYGLLGALFCYSVILDIRNDNTRKSLLYVYPIVTLYIFYKIQGLLLTQYADVFCSVLILFYGVVLIRNPREVKTYWLRFIIIALLSVSIYFVKTPYLIFSLLMFVFFLLRDLKFIVSNKNKLLLDLPFILSIIGILGYLLIVLNYASQFRNISIASIGIFDRILTIDKTWFNYLFKIAEFILQNIGILAILFTSLLVLYLTRLTKVRFNIIVSLILLLIMILLPILFYSINGFPLEDMSLFRYLSLSFFFSCYFFIIVTPKTETNNLVQKVFISFLSLALACVLSIKIVIDSNFNLYFTPTTGSYKNLIWHQDQYNISEEVRNLVEDDSRIMIVDKEYDQIGNMDLPAIILRYYISDFSVGGQYRYGVDEWYSHMQSINPDFILVYSYDGYWFGCNSILEVGHSYLIEQNSKNKINNLSDCFFQSEQIKEL